MISLIHFFLFFLFYLEYYLETRICVSCRMHSFFTYMNNPQIVADFQKIFGLEWEFDVNKDHTQQADNDTNSTGTNGHLTQLDENNNNDFEKFNSNGTLRSRKTGKAQANGHSNAQSTASSKSSSTSISSSSDHVVTNTDHSHLISKTKINIKFW